MPEVAAVGAIAVQDGALLLVQRGHPPDVGKWSVPGGRVEPGETDEAAVVREMFEETAVHVRVNRFIGEVVRHGPGEVVYRIRDYLVDVVAGTPAAGDDAAAVEWVAFGDLPQRELPSGLLDALRSWAVLP
ncbi:MAG: NUDIX hydrolase [Acidothermaceae bacterium]